MRLIIWSHFNSNIDIMFSRIYYLTSNPHVSSLTVTIFFKPLGPHTFELVTASKVLHVRATTSYEVSAWIDAIKLAIGKSYLGRILDLRDLTF